MDWEDVRSFLAIARARTLSGAARELGVRQSTMSRRLEALETRAGARLLQRTASGYELTPLGEAVLGNAERMEAEAITVERIVQGRDVALSGTVRVTTVDLVAEMLLPDAIAALQALYPRIVIDVLSDPRSYNLSRREADIAIRMTRFKGNQLVSRRVATAASGLYASAAYVEAHGGLDGAPQGGGGSGSGAGHAVITVLEDQANIAEARWLVEQVPQARVALRSNSRSAQAAAARAGLGIVCLPCMMAEAMPGLVRLSGQAAGPSREIWLGVHEDLRHMPRIRAVIDALNAMFARHQRALSGAAA